MNNRIFLLVGKSGSGKSYIANLFKRYGLQEIESYTTRSPRTPNESGHTFVNDEAFDTLTDLVAYTEFDGHRYVATADQVERCGVYVIDEKGVDYFKQHYHGDKIPTVIYVQANKWTRFTRMVKRNGLRGAIRRIINDRIMFDDDWVLHNADRMVWNNRGANMEDWIAYLMTDYKFIDRLVTRI